jgi:hypothetical protein
MSSLLARKKTVRAPSAAELLTLASKETPGVLSVDVMERMLLTLMSCGPSMVTVMLPLSPWPNMRTLMVAPREMVAPTFDADPPPPIALTPNTCAFGAGLEAGEETLISIPATAWPAGTLTNTGGLTGVGMPGVGVGTGVGAGGGLEVLVGEGVGLFELPPPQPLTTNAMATAPTRDTLRYKGPPRKDRSRDAAPDVSCCPTLRGLLPSERLQFPHPEFLNRE